MTTISSRKIMSKRIFLVAMMFLISFLHTTPAEAGNLLWNPGFEKGLEAWEVPPSGWIMGRNVRQPVIDKVVFQGQGNASLKMVGGGGKRGSVFQVITHNPEIKTYRISGWIKLQDFENTGIARISVQCGRGVELLEVFSVSTPLRIINMDWQKFEMEFAVPSGTSFIRIVLDTAHKKGWGEFEGMNKGTAWFDNIILEGFTVKGQKVSINKNSEAHPFWTRPPRENLPPLTEELKKHVLSRPEATAKVVTLPNGAPQLVVNGVHFPSLVTLTRRAGPLFICSFENTGFRIHTVEIDAGFVKDFFWAGKNKFRPEVVEELLWEVLRADPDAYIILNLRIEPYRGWDIEHPDDLKRNEAGYPFIVGAHFKRIGNNPDRGRLERFAWSFFSENWKKQSSEMIRELISVVEKSIPGRAVIGYFLFGGQDGQLYSWHPPNHILQRSPQMWGDFSNNAVRAWRSWAKEKYVSIEKLNNAWGEQYESFSSIKPPQASLLTPPHPFHHPILDRKIIDWKHFLAEGRSALINHYAKVVRKHATRDIVIGAYTGESGVRRDLNASHSIITNPNIDIIIHQATYARRLPGQMGGINAIVASHALNSKIFLADIDHPTWLIEPVIKEVAVGIPYNTLLHRGWASNAEEFGIMFRRVLGRLWADGAGGLLHRHAANWQYEDPEIKNELRILYDTFQPLPFSSPTQPAAEVAVIYDEESVHYLASSLSRLHNIWATVNFGELNASGVPYKAYYAEDLRDGLVPHHEMVIFLNQINLDTGMQKAIKRLREAGTTLVFLQGAGAKQSFADIRQLSKVLGMEVERVGKELNRKPVERSGKFIKLQTLLNEPPSNLKNMAKQQGLDLWGQEDRLEITFLYDDIMSLQVTDPRAHVLAFYPGTNKVAAALVTHGNYKTVFIGSTVINRYIIHELARIAGAWYLTSPSTVVAASENFLMVHPLADGITTITLKEEKKLLEPIKNMATERSKVHHLNLRKNTTYLFLLK